MRAFGKKRAGQAAGAGPDLDHGDAGKRSRGAGDARRQVEVEQEVLAEALAGAKLVAGDDLAQRRQVVERTRHPASSFRLNSAARRSEAARLAGSALPVPAMSNAVPWSGEVRTKASPSVTLTPSVEGQRLDRDQRLVVIHAQHRVVGRPRRRMEHGVGGQGPARRDALGLQRRDRRAHDALVLVADGAAFAGMRVDAGDGQARVRHARSGASASRQRCGRYPRSGAR